MAKYFQSFPLYYYDGALCKNIMQRTTMREDIKKNYINFYDVLVDEGERPDVVAYQLYGDQYYDWLLYYSNDVVDPYDQWYLSHDRFIEMIKIKYGSVAEASERVIFYRNNWVTDDRQLPVAAYEALIPVVKKYWESVVDDSTGRILYYRRRRDESTTHTNSIVELRLADSKQFQIGEHVIQRSGSVVAASGDVVRVKNNIVTVNHIVGTFTSGNVIGMSSDITGNLVEATLVARSIPLEEQAYWGPVSYYEYELERNEQRKVLKALLPNFAREAIQTHKELLNETV
jgi:hypothetical protein